MIVSRWKVILEFDGNRFHKQKSNILKDENKTRTLSALGWTVIRIREALPLIGENDVVVPIFSNALTRAKMTLKKLYELGFEADRLQEYLIADEPWGAAEAERSFKRHLSRSLKTENPSLAEEWDSVKNGDITPGDVTPGNAYKAWWRCKQCSHSWKAAVYSRSNGCGCPVCGKESSALARNAPMANRSLAAIFPQVAADWHPDRNGILTPESTGAYSHKEIWWLCSTCGHEWATELRRRTRYRSGCPFGCGKPD
ncbi:MAG: zinc-ribbon domain-containing protein [Segniliparus sp.]|uniref:zinc-ribbon domain-containing protein n=1 Tax=Segniliparus sp. TaxID=2804064 RepID=UPI003F3E7CDD